MGDRVRNRKLQSEVQTPSQTPRAWDGRKKRHQRPERERREEWTAQRDMQTGQRQRGRGRGRREKRSREAHTHTVTPHHPSPRSNWGPSGDSRAWGRAAPKTPVGSSFGFS